MKHCLANGAVHSGILDFLDLEERLQEGKIKKVTLPQVVSLLVPFHDSVLYFADAIKVTVDLD